MTNPGIIGSGLGRIWKFDGTTATLEVRGLSLAIAGYGDASGLLVRTNNARTGTNDGDEFQVTLTRFQARQIFRLDRSVER